MYNRKAKLFRSSRKHRKIKYITRISQQEQIHVAQRTNRICTRIQQCSVSTLLQQSVVFWREEESEVLAQILYRSRHRLVRLRVMSGPRSFLRETTKNTDRLGHKNHLYNAQVIYSFTCTCIRHLQWYSQYPYIYGKMG